MSWILEYFVYLLCVCTSIYVRLVMSSYVYGLGRPAITSEIGNWSVFVLLGCRFVFGIIMK